MQDFNDDFFGFFPDPGCRGFIPQKTHCEPLVVKVNEQMSGKKN